MTTTPTETLLEDAVRVLDDADLDTAAKLGFIDGVNDADPRAGREIRRCLIERDATMRNAIEELRGLVSSQGEMLDKLTAPPLAVATVVDAAVETPQGAWVRVISGGTESLVRVGPGLDQTPVRTGDEVYLAAESKVILARSASGPRGVGEVVMVEHDRSDGRLILKHRDTELAVTRAAAIADQSFRQGDRVLLDSRASMAMEAVEASDVDRQDALEDIGEVLPEALAGYDEIRDRALRRVVNAVVHPELAKTFGIEPGNKRLLLIGPPGCGKTTLMRIAGAMLARETGQVCRVAKVNGAELYRPYVGETEQIIKDLVERLAAHAGPAILFFDEIDAIGRIRGGLGNVHGDRFLGTILAQLEGIGGRSRVMVIAATNRADMLDPALRERFSWEIEVERPRMRAARAIFEHHLPASLPFDSQADTPLQARDEALLSAVARLFDPNADNEVATLRFHDGTLRVVHARELISGRVIEQACNAVCDRAFDRAIDTGRIGITRQDVDGAVGDLIDRLRATLTRHNVWSYLADLPQDADVVAVEPVRRAARRLRFVQ